MPEEVKYIDPKESIHSKQDIQYNSDNKRKKIILNDIFKSIKNNKEYDPFDKEISYDAIQIETEELLNREKTIFTINSIIIIGLIITIFRIG
jgi:hypothetical protein